MPGLPPLLRLLLVAACFFVASSVVTAGDWRFQQWRRALDAAAKISNAAEAAKAWQEAPADSTESALLLQRWAQLDPSGAFHFFLEAKKIVNAAHVLHTWALHDAPAAAEAWFQARRAIVDSKGELLMPFASRFVCVEDVLAENLALADPQAALAMARRLRDESGASCFRDAALGQVAAREPRTVLKFVGGETSLPTDCLVKAGGALGREDIDRARRLIGELPDRQARNELLQAALAGWAESAPRAALREAWKRARASEKRQDATLFSCEDVFVSAVTHQPKTAMQWVATLERDDQSHFLRHLGRQMEREELPNAAAFEPAATRAGVTPAAVGQLPPVFPAKPRIRRPGLPAYRPNASLFERSQQLAEFLAALPPNDFPDVWDALLRNQSDDREWLRMQRMAMLAAWTMKDPASAFRRSVYSGFRPESEGEHENDSVAVLREWVARDRTSFLAEWDRGLKLFSVYDESGQFARINAAAIAASAWAGQDPAEAWAWYRGALQPGERPPPRKYDAGYVPVRLPVEVIPALAKLNVDTAFHELALLREAAHDPLDEAALRAFYIALGTWCRAQRLPDADQRAAQLPFGDRTSFLGGLRPGEPVR